MEPKYFYEAGDTSRDLKLKLSRRVSEIRTTLDKLKEQLNSEQSLLNSQKLGFPQRPLSPISNQIRNEIGCREGVTISPHHSDFHERRQQQEQEPSVPINKEHLEDIERKCEAELQKLDCYIQNVQILKNMWIRMREAENTKRQEKPDFREKIINQSELKVQNVGVAKKCPGKGRIFYL